MRNRNLYAALLFGASLFLLVRTETPAFASETARLSVDNAKIVCRGKEFDGLRGTLIVPENRSRTDSRLIELPIVVVKSTSATSGYPVFQCTGGPGGSNIGPEQRIGEADLRRHDVVQVGYRGFDGTPQLKHPLFDEIFATPEMLSPPGLRAMGAKAAQAVAELKAAGLDVEHYNILNVVDDIEAARAALGYEKINLTGGSYGGAVVLTYCLRYPDRVHRAMMIEAAFPYDIAFGTSQEVDARFEHLNKLWRQDPNAVKRSPGIVQTMKDALKKLPKEYNGIPIDSAKVRIVTYLGLYERTYVNMLFDAYISAEQGDFGSLAVMSLMFDQLMGNFENVGDLLAKTYSSVTDPQRDFIAELDDPDSIIGSPMALMAWGAFQHSDWPVKSVAQEHPPTQTSPVETLIVYGSKEAGKAFRDKYGAMFTNAHWVMFDDLGHMDVWKIIGPGMSHLIHRFLDHGAIDTSQIGAIPKWDFTPQATFLQMFQQMTAPGGPQEREPK
ncbi:MAG: alpha/beta fold hydrolase [Phycisphaerales bacterium]|nr:MAG: alpha/beta fold hydrolase [Phycisphaerales bacterium]